MSEPVKKTTCIELDIGVKWAHDNPRAALDAFHKFVDQYKGQGVITVHKPLYGLYTLQCTFHREYKVP